MAVPRSVGIVRYLGFFLQCNADDNSPNWTCHATGVLKIVSFDHNVIPFCRQMDHWFNSKANDWGFGRFIAWDDLLNPEHGFIENDAIVLQVHIWAYAPRFLTN